MTYPPMGGPGGYPPPNPYGADATVVLNQMRKKSNRRLTIILSAVVVVLALVLALAANQVYFSKTGKALIPGLTLRAANDTGPDPFTEPVTLLNNVPATSNNVPSAPDNGVQVVNGTAPGLYAVSSVPSCDTAALGNRLAANPGAASAWASVFGIRPGDIPWYLNTLTPVVLTADTWVTNHSYTSGRAVPFQAVLQSGTAVYVDGYGVPRAVCSCGNPLRPPAAAPISGYRVYGDRWAGHDFSRTTRIAYHDTYVDNRTIVHQTVNPPAPAALQVTDLATMALVAREVGNLLLDLGPAPAGFQEPDPVVLNAPFVSDNGEDSALNGTQEGSAAPNETVAERASRFEVPQLATEEETDEPDAVEQSATSREEAAPESNAVDDPAVSSPPSSSAAQPVPTSFSGSSGDAIGSLTFADGDRTVTCRFPSTFDGSTVAPDSASDAACSGLQFSADDLRKTTVDRVVAADPNGVWTVSAIGRSQPITVVSATWQTLTAATSTTTTTTEAPTTTEEPVATPEPTTQEPVVTPTQEVVTPTPEPTTTVAPEPTPETEEVPAS